MGNPVTALPGNQRGCSLNFHYFSATVTVISCLNYQEVNGSLDDATAEEVMGKMKESRGGMRSGDKTGRDEEIFIASSARLTLFSRRQPSSLPLHFTGSPPLPVSSHVHMNHYYPLVGMMEI